MKPIAKFIAAAVLLAVCVTAVLFLRRTQSQVRHVSTSMQDVQVVRDYFLRRFVSISRDNDSVVLAQDKSPDRANRLSPNPAPSEDKLVLRAQESFTSAGTDISIAYTVSSIGPEAVEIMYTRTSAASAGPDSAITTDKGTVEIPYSPSWASVVSKGNTEGVKELLQQGMDVNSSDGFGRTPLFLAAMQEDREMAALLLSNGADPNARPDNRMTALMMAADNAGMVKLLVDAGSEVNARDVNGDTALMWSLRDSNNQLPDPAFDLLINSGADPSIPNVQGVSVNSYLIQHNVQYTMPPRVIMNFPSVPHLDKKGNKHEDKFPWKK